MSPHESHGKAAGRHDGRPRDTNGFAIAALVCGLIPLGLGLLSIIFGIVALYQVARSGEKGRGLAIAGIASTGGWFLLLILFIAVMALADGPAGRGDDGQVTSRTMIRVESLRLGDCVAKLEEGRIATRLPVVPCSDPHEGEVFAIFDLPGGEWPGEEVVWQEAELTCLDHLSDYSHAAYEDDQVSIFYVHPTSRSWRTGDRGVVCSTLYLDGPRSGGLAGDRGVAAGAAAG